jgi:transcriptional regulator with XRE-family HTH domain
VNVLRIWFKKIRDDLNLTQVEIAKKVGVTRQYIGMIESGVASPHPDTAKIIAKSLNFKKYGYDWTEFYASSEQGDVKKESQSISKASVI